MVENSDNDEVKIQMKVTILVVKVHQANDNLHACQALVRNVLYIWVPYLQSTVDLFATFRSMMPFAGAADFARAAPKKRCGVRVH